MKKNFVQTYVWSMSHYMNIKLETSQLEREKRIGILCSVVIPKDVENLIP